MTDQAAAQDSNGNHAGSSDGASGDITFTFQWTERGWFRWTRDYNCRILGRRLNWILFRWAGLPLPPVLAGGFFVAKILGLGPVELPDAPTTGQMMLALLPWCAGWVAALPLAHLIHYWMVTRVFRKNPALALRQDWVIDRNRACVRTDQNTQTLECSGVRNTMELGSGFWLGQGAHTGLLVPREPLEQTGQIEAFRALLDRRGSAQPRG